MVSELSARVLTGGAGAQRAAALDDHGAGGAGPLQRLAAAYRNARGNRAIIDQGSGAKIGAGKLESAAAGQRDRAGAGIQNRRTDCPQHILELVAVPARSIGGQIRGSRQFQRLAGA